MSTNNPDTVPDTVPAPLVRLLSHHGGPTLPDPLPASQIPADVERAYLVLTSAAILRMIDELEANPPQAIADVIADDPARAEQWRIELAGMRGLEMRIQDIAGPVMAQLYPFILQQHAPR